MKPRISLVTLGVDDLDRAVRFYAEGLGLKTDGVVGREFEHGAVAFFDLEGGMRLALWPRASLAHDSRGWRRRDAARSTSALRTTSLPVRKSTQS